jgi:hypothetical protein
MLIGRKAIVCAAIAATAAGTMMVAAPNAMATLGNCTISYPGGFYGITSVCTSGTGYQEIDVIMYLDSQDGEQADVGNCAAIGQVSKVHVPWPDIISVSIFQSNSSNCS